VQNSIFFGIILSSSVGKVANQQRLTNLNLSWFTGLQAALRPVRMEVKTISSPIVIPRLELVAVNRYWNFDAAKIFVEVNREYNTRERNHSLY